MTLAPPTLEQRREAIAAEFWLCATYPKLVRAFDEYGPYDARLWDGAEWWTVQIKWTDRRFGRLIRRADEARWCDFYVLVTGTSDNFRVAGWARGEELRKHWDTDLPEPGWAMRQQVLRYPIDEMLEDFEWPY